MLQSWMKGGRAGWSKSKKKLETREKCIESSGCLMMHVQVITLSRGDV